MHARILFFSVYWAQYYTYVVKQYLQTGCCYAAAMLLAGCCYAAAMLLVGRCYAAAMLLSGCCYAGGVVLLCCCYAAAMLLSLCCCRYAQHYLFIGLGLLYSTMPFRLELFNCSLSRPCFATIQRALLDWSIWCNQWLYPTFQYMPMYVLPVCLYVLSITLDRLVLCTPSVLRFHLGVYAPTGIFLCVAERNKEY